MPEIMANNANGNVAAVNGQRPQRDPSPELRQPGCWGKLWCLGSSRKRGMRITPVQGTGNTSNAWASNGASSSTAVNQFVGLSPSLLAPPSSPASFANSGNPSTVQSPASFTVSLCVPTANVVCSPAFDSTATMFTIGPYAHETTLVTPPAFSAFTTAPSTAPFTPPPELAHLTTPSSPDVPFAQLLASSLKNAKGGSSAPQPASASPFASPDYVSRSGEMQTTYQMYPESPLASLISPASGISESGPPSPLPESAIVASNKPTTLSMRRITSTAFELPSKRPVEISTSSTATPQSESANHSRELEPIKFLSPFMDYNDAEATTITTTTTDDDPDRRQAELSVLEEWRLLTCQSSSSTAACRGPSESAVQLACRIPTQGVACRIFNTVMFPQSLSEGGEYQESSEAGIGEVEAVFDKRPTEGADFRSSDQAPACETSADPAACPTSSSLTNITSKSEAASSSSQAGPHSDEAATSSTEAIPMVSSSSEAATSSTEAISMVSSSREAATSSIEATEMASSSIEAATSSTEPTVMVSSSSEAATSSTEANAMVSSASEAAATSSSEAATKSTEATAIGSFSSNAATGSTEAATSSSEADVSPNEPALANPSGVEADVVASKKFSEAIAAVVAGQISGEAAASGACETCGEDAGAAQCSSEQAAAPDLETRNLDTKRMEAEEEQQSGDQQEVREEALEPDGRCSGPSSMLVVELTIDDVVRLQQQHEPGTPKNGVNGFRNRNGYSAELLTKPPPGCLLLGVVHSNEEQQMKTQDGLV